MSYHKITIIGRVGQAPKLNKTRNGKQVCNFTVAINEYDDNTVWYKATAWGNQAETCAKFLLPGREVHIEGRPSIDTYTNGNGVTRSSLKVTINTITFLSGGPKVAWVDPEEEEVNDDEPNDGEPHHEAVEQKPKEMSVAEARSYAEQGKRIDAMIAGKRAMAIAKAASKKKAEAKLERATKKAATS